jgi:hypothetical protein
MDRRPLRVLATILLTVEVGGAVTLLTQWPIVRENPALAAVNVAFILACLATSALLMGDPERRRTALAFVGTAVLFDASWLNEWKTGVLPLVGVLTSAWPACLAWVLLTYPRSRVEHGYERLVLLLIAGWLSGGQLAIAECPTSSSWSSSSQ